MGFTFVEEDGKFPEELPFPHLEYEAIRLAHSFTAISCPFPLNFLDLKDFVYLTISIIRSFLNNQKLPVYVQLELPVYVQ